MIIRNTNIISMTFNIISITHYYSYNRKYHHIQLLYIVYPLNFLHIIQECKLFFVYQHYSSNCKNTIFAITISIFTSISLEDERF